MTLVTLSLSDGSSLAFDSATAKDCGDYVGEFVHQKCSVAVNGPWRAFFRPDADGSRQEVVVEYGLSFSGTPAHITAPYTATISDGTTILYSATIPVHWWGGRWRWQSASRRVVRSPDVLRSRHWIGNFGAVGLYGKPAPTTALKWGGPMTPLAGVDPSMGTAGDHDQIGLLTEAAADYMIRPSDVTLASLRAEGEWLGNACIHFRNDDASMFDVAAQQLRYKANGGTLVPPPAAPSPANPAFIIPEYAHFYPCATAGWLLADDPYLLEELQFAATWLMLQNAWTKRYGSISGGQTRAFAWGMRDLFACALTTPASVPIWLKPASYFAACVGVNLTWAQQFANAAARIHALFRAWTRTDYLDAWMSSWLTTIIGLAVEAGFSDWRPIFDWAVQQHIAMTDGSSGWNRQVCAPYEWFARRKFVEWTELCDTTADADTCASWADAWAYLCAGAIPENAPTTSTGAPNYMNRNADGSHLIDHSGWDGHTLMSGIAGMGTSYVGHLRAALAQAVRLGTTGAQACYDYLNTEYPILLAKKGVYGQARFSIDPVGGSAVTTAATVVTDIETAQAAVATAQTDAAAAGVTGAVVPLASAASYLTTALAAAQAVVNPPPPPTGALSTLASGCVRPLGPFSSDLTGFHRSDYSCIVYDPTGKRMLFFGGGHGLGQYTDIIAFDLTKLAWSSLYPSTLLSDMVAANADYTRGCWTTTGQPIARHSYINNCVAANRLYLMTGSSYDLVLAQAPVAWYDLTAGTWSYSAAGNPAWLYTSGACPDPQSTNVVVLGTDQQASGWYQLWLYDTATDKIANPCRFNLAGHMNLIRYLPSRDVFVSMQTNGVVWELALNRANPSASSLAPVTTTGTVPAWIAPQPMGFGANGNMLLGGVYKGVVFSYDMEARAWSQTQAKNEDGSNASANQAFYCADFDPMSGCLIFLGLDGQTYAYRP